MTDKVQKIREEVEKIFNEALRRAKITGADEYWTGKADAYRNALIIIDSLQEEPVNGLDNGDMPIERWKQAVEAASNQRSYRSSKGLTETRDDYFVDGVQWADEHPKEEPVSENTMTIRKEWFEHCKESWYNEGYIDGKYNRDRQFKEPVSEDLEEACEQLAENARKHKAETSSPFFSQTDYIQGVMDGAKWQITKLMANATPVTSRDSPRS